MGTAAPEALQFPGFPSAGKPSRRQSRPEDESKASSGGRKSLDRWPTHSLTSWQKVCAEPGKELRSAQRRSGKGRGSEVGELDELVFERAHWNAENAVLVDPAQP
jgi:hypothetical protein